MKIPGGGTDPVSEVQCKHSKWFSRGKIKFLKWLLLKSFSFFFFWCAHKRKDLQVQEEHSSIMLSLLKGELCPLAFSVLYSCSLQSVSQMEGWRSTTRRSNPNICLATAEAFHWDKTQACSVWYHCKWFLCLIGNNFCTLLPAERC